MALVYPLDFFFLGELDQYSGLLYVYGYLSLRIFES